MDEIYKSNDIRIDLNSSSNTSADEFLISIRNRKKKGNNSSNKTHNSYATDESSAFSCGSASLSPNSNKYDSTKRETSESINNMETDIDRLNENKSQNKIPKQQNFDTDHKDIEIKEEEEENDINKKIIENFNAMKPNKKKKKKKSAGKKKRSLFDPDKYQKRELRITSEQKKWMPPKIIKPQKDIDEMVDRLSKPSPCFDNQIPDYVVQKKQPSDPQVFIRLFEMSTEKEKKKVEKRIQIEKERDEAVLNFSPKSNTKSQQLAEKMLLRFVERCFNQYPKDSIILSLDMPNNDTSSINQSQSKNDSQDHIDNQDTKENKTDENSTLGLSESNDYYFKNEFSQKEVDELLIDLGLTSPNENKPKYNKILFDRMNDWVLKEKQDGSKVYDSIKIYNEMIHVIKEGEFSSSYFDKFARQRIIIALSNSKQFNSLSKTSIYSSNNESLFKPSNESLSNNENTENASYQIKKEVQEQSMIRLSQSKRKNEPSIKSKNNSISSLNIRPRPKFKMNPYSEELEPAPISAKTEKIFQKSEVANIPFVDRDKFFTEKRKAMIQQMSKESNKSQLMIFENKPKFTIETWHELDEYKQKKKMQKNKKKDDEPTYRPKVFDYEKYKKTIHKKMTEKKVRPEGWDNDIIRHRVAYQKHLQEKKSNEKDIEQKYDMMNEFDIVSKYEL